MRSHRTLVAAVLTALLVPAFAVPAGAQSYPRLGLYGSILGDWRPYVLPGGALDTVNIARAARYHAVVLDAYPVSPYRPDVVEAMRARNPQSRFLAYVLADDIWQVADSDSTRHLPTLIRRTVRDLDGFLYENTGAEYVPTNINLAKRVGGRFVVAEAMADLFRDRVIATGTWDGLFVDVFCHTVGWTSVGTGRTIDHVRAGYPSLAALDAAWSEASDTLAARLHRAAPPGFELVGNCGPSAEHEWFNGWMRENFPLQQGGTWASNMLGDVTSRGYLRDDLDYLSPPRNWILSIANTTPGQQYDAFNTQQVRYGLASASLGDGLFAFGPGAKTLREAPYHEWWYDEYAVDLATGRSSEAQPHTGWLGAAQGAARTMVWVSTAPDAVTNPGFESSVSSGWTFGRFAPAAATIVRDVTTAAVGTASAHVSVTSASTVGWHVNLTSVGQLALQAGVQYSVTFWCKASGPRIVEVVAGNSGGRAFVAVDTEWRQYQAVLTPTTSMSAPVIFFLGLQTGDVWFDDVHFQAGTTSVWRRDFANGIVLVNPGDRPLDVRLEGPFRRLLGTRAPVVNDGSVSDVQTVGARDALFLLRSDLDTTPPAGVRDLRIGP